MRPLQVLLGFLIFSVFGFIGWQLKLLYESQCDDYFSRSTNERGMDIRCIEKTSVFFLKTHKCGSSTVQNVLMRFGRHRNLSFVLPNIGNYVGNPEHFSPEFIGTNVSSPNSKTYDIFTHHTRYSHKAIRSIMREGAPFVTIMREPIALQISMYHYYELHYFTGYSLPHLLQQNFDYLQTLPRYWQRIGWNQMAWDLGITIPEMSMSRVLMKLINKLENEFNLVMITEFMEASLVLFADLMCWPLEEVRFITINAMYEGDNSSYKKPVLTKEEKAVLEKLNEIDIQLYSHFRQRFKQRILEYGADRMISEVNRLLDMNLKLHSDCIEKDIIPKTEGPALIRYKLKLKVPLICREVVLPELNFTDILRKEQEKRFEVTRNLLSFVHN